VKFFVQSNKGQREIILPTSWATCPTEKYIQMATEWDAADMVKLFSILSGIEYKTLSETKDANLEQQLIIATRFVYEETQRFKDAPVPESLTIQGKTVKIPKEVGGLSIGQSIHVRREMEKAKYIEELIAFATAIYLQPLVHGEDFDFVKAMELLPAINKMPITEIYPVGFFLLLPLTKHGSNTLKLSYPLRIQWLNIFRKSAKT
jgi:hypothetical protein